MATIIREAVYIDSKKIISIVTTSSEVARGLLALTDDSNIENVSMSGTNDVNGVLNWLDIIVRGDLSEKAMASVKRVIQDCRDVFVVKSEEKPEDITDHQVKIEDAEKKVYSKSSKKSTYFKKTSNEDDDGDQG